MPTQKKGRKIIETEEPKPEFIWRKPIILDEDINEDPLATLYGQGNLKETLTVKENLETKEETKPQKNKILNSENEFVDNKSIETFKQNNDKNKKTQAIKIPTKNKNNNIQSASKVNISELKSILRIKSETFIFTDIREILRGKSLEIYSYLRHLSGETGVCKIKHVDLMQILDISRPTLFKQGDWLTKLSLIEKSNVPGDHFGTSYTVHRLEEVLPVSETLIQQLQSSIDSFSEK